MSKEATIGKEDKGLLDLEKKVVLLVDLKEVEADLKCLLDKLTFAASKLHNITKALEKERDEEIEKIR